MRIMVVGANQGLDRAFIEGLGGNGDHLIGVSRRMPVPLPLPVRDVFHLVRMLMLTPSAYVKEVVMPSIGDARF